MAANWWHWPPWWRRGKRIWFGGKRLSQLWDLVLSEGEGDSAGLKDFVQDRGLYHRRHHSSFILSTPDWRDEKKKVASNLSRNNFFCIYDVMMWQTLMSRTHARMIPSGSFRRTNPPSVLLDEWDWQVTRARSKLKREFVDERLLENKIDICYGRFKVLFFILETSSLDFF